MDLQEQVARLDTSARNNWLAQAASSLNLSHGHLSSLPNANMPKQVHQLLLNLAHLPLNLANLL